MTARPWPRPRPRVHSLAIELTAFCNQRCDYCYNAWRADGGASLGTASLSFLLARIDRVLDAVDLEHVTLTGGEPLASHQLFPVLAHLRARHVRAQLISNGTLVTPEIAARLARHRLLSVLVTLNGPDAALHDAQVGGAHFDATVRGIATLRAHRIPVEGCVVISKRNADRVAETLRLFLSLGVRKIALSRFSPAGYSLAFARELMPSRDDVGRALAAAMAVARAESSRAPVQLFSTMPNPALRRRALAVPGHRVPRLPNRHAAAGVRPRPHGRGPSLRAASRPDRRRARRARPFARRRQRSSAPGIPIAIAPSSLTIAPGASTPRPAPAAAARRRSGCEGTTRRWTPSSPPRAKARRAAGSL